MNGFLSQKDKSCDKKEERREKERLERETASKLFFELQKKRLDIEEENARTRAREADARAGRPRLGPRRPRQEQRRPM